MTAAVVDLAAERAARGGPAAAGRPVLEFGEHPDDCRVVMRLARRLTPEDRAKLIDAIASGFPDAG